MINKCLNNTLSRKNGFTLIEVLAIIILLGVIALIFTPNILNIFGISNDNAFEEDVKNLVHSAELYQLDNTYKTKVFDLTNSDDCAILNLSKKELTGIIETDDSGVKNIFISNGTTCAYGNDLEINYSMCDKLEKVLPEVSVSQKKINGKTNITINAYDNSDVSYIQLPNGQKVGTSSKIVNGKDESIKIAIIRDGNNDTVTRIQKSLSSMFSNVEFNPLLTVQQIIDGKYDVVVDDAIYWSVSNGDDISKLFEQGINIYTAGNDTVSLKIIKNNSYTSTASAYNSNRVVNNEVTSSIKNPLPLTSDGQYIVNLIDEAEVWYTTSHSNANYDVIGYWENEQGTRWIHSQPEIGYSNDTYRRIIYRLSRKKSATYTVDKSGIYSFKVADIYGNTKTVNVTVE